MSYKTHMHGNREWHSGIVPTKQPNESQGGPQEVVEGRPLTKENRSVCVEQYAWRSIQGKNRVR